MTIAAELLPGTLVDRRYRIQRVLGRGGFGRTYLVVDKWRFGELCVLKEFAPSNRGDAVVTQKLRELFQREATILHKLSHPQIPKFFAVFEENSRLFIVQEYVNGKTYWSLLREKHQNGTTFSESEILQWLKDLLRVLGYLHKQNIVHRDISPDNIMLARGKKLPILIDFGAVKQAAARFNQAHSPADGLIQASVSVGKSGYAPYEQLRLGQCSPRSDLYALAVTAVVLLTAKPPSQLIDPSSLEWKWQSWVQLSPPLIKILSKMMAEKPQDRYASAESVLKDLQRISPSVSPPPLPPAPQWLPEQAEQATRLQFQRVGSLFSQAQLAPEPAAPALPPKLAQSTRLQRPSEEKASLAYRHTQHVSLQSSTSSPSQPKAMLPKVLLSFPEGKLSLLWSKLLIGGCLALLPVGGVVLGVHSSYIASVCHALDNCAADQQTALIYQQSVRQATAAQTLSEMAKNLPDLRLARNQLSAAVAQLSSLTTEGLATEPKLLKQAQQQLQAYRSNLNLLEARLEKESKATELLARAKAEAQQANELTTIATQTQNYGAARQKWTQALGTLRSIRESNFTQNQVAVRSQEYASRLETLDLRIAALNPRPAQAQTAQTVAQAVPPQAAPPIAANPFQILIGAPLTEPASSRPTIQVARSPQIQASQIQASPTQAPQASQIQPPQPRSQPIAPPEQIAYAPATPRTVTPRTVTPRISTPRISTPRTVTPRIAAASRPATPATALRNIAPQSAIVSSYPQEVAAPSRPAAARTPTPVLAVRPPQPAPEQAQRLITQTRAASSIRANPPASTLIATAPQSAPTQSTTQAATLAQQTLNNVSIQLDGARVSPDGTVAANLVVENHSDRTFGFVPLFAEVKDADGNVIRSRVQFTNTDDGIAEPGEVLHGQIHMFNRPWNSSGSQNLALVIQEGTTGSRNFRLTF